MKTKFLFHYVVVAFLTLAITSSCSSDDDEFDSTYTALFSTTDYFIDMLDKIYESYDLLGKKAKDTSDGKFTVTPMGRLIIVKKKASASSITYSNIESALKSHYQTSIKVKDVFINNGGTVTIDCRK